MSKKQLMLSVFLVIVAAGGAWYWQALQSRSSLDENKPFDWSNVFNPDSGTTSDSTEFGTSVKYESTDVTVDPAIAKDFSIDDIVDLAKMGEAYGFTLSSAELAALQNRKFVIKNLMDTNIRPQFSGRNADLGREIVGLYGRTRGDIRDPKLRGPENAMLFTADVFFTSFNNLYTELLKEIENEVFYPNVKTLTQKFYEDASTNLAAATTDADQTKWRKIRNYFAVSHALFQTAAEPLEALNYYDNNGNMIDPAQVMAEWEVKDKEVDTYDHAASFVKDLHLDSESETSVLADLETIFKAEGKNAPEVFAREFADYKEQEGIDFLVDFTQFTPRGTYTSSSLRREYFRGMKWYIMIPFFVKSPALTSYAYGAADLMAQNPDALKNYNQLESAINFLIGNSDDLMPVDYLASLQSADPMDYLKTARNPKIKDLSAMYDEVGTEESDDVLLKTKGMRFFSGKFLMDSYWTGFMTQGDEAPRPGFTQKLPPMASALEVMTLLGSDYAKAHIPEMDFYSDANKEAINQALGILAEQQAVLTDEDWQKNIATGWLWTINGLFDWQQKNHDALPQFMQSEAWGAKTLMTANAFWTQLRHAAILYAKQSFAELGGGGPGACDPQLMPAPAKGYIEPAVVAYDRLSFIAKRLSQGLEDQGFSLSNQERLKNFINVMDLVQGYVVKELGNDALREEIASGERTDDGGVTC
ncbi:MAG: DUF3160 domain-containing protein, partial [Patescibacteria group bacterium]